MKTYTQTHRHTHKIAWCLFIAVVDILPNEWDILYLSLLFNRPNWRHRHKGMEREQERKRLNKCTEQQKNLYEAVECTISHFLFKNVQRIFLFGYTFVCLHWTKRKYFFHSTIEFELKSNAKHRNDVNSSKTQRKTNRQQPPVQT